MCETEPDTTLLTDHNGDLSQLFKDPDHTSQEVVRAIFDLKQGEIGAYFALTKHPRSSPDHLADVLDQHRRYVARSLRGLHDVNLAERERETLNTGGQGYVYDPVPVEDAKQYLKEQLDEWTVHLRTEIENLDSTIETELACDGRADNCSQGGVE